MKKIVKLTEHDLIRIVRRVIAENTMDEVQSYLENDLGYLRMVENPSEGVIIYKNGNRPIFHYFIDEEEKGNGYYYINDEVWEKIKKMGHDDEMIEIMISVWLDNYYNLRELTPMKFSYRRKED